MITIIIGLVIAIVLQIEMLVVIKRVKDTRGALTSFASFIGGVSGQDRADLEEQMKKSKRNIKAVLKGIFSYLRVKAVEREDGTIVLEKRKCLKK